MVGLVATLGCSSGSGPLTSATTGAAGGSTGAAGTTSTTGGAGTGAAGSGAAGAGTAGSGAAGTSTAGTGAAGTGTAGASDAGTSDADASDVSAAGTSDAGTSDAGAAGTTAPADITKVVPTTGCGMDPGQALGTLVGPLHIMTMGTKDASCADSKCGAWMYTRDYWVQLPATYDKTKAYPLVFEGPGCGGMGNNLYSIPSFDQTVIRVGLSPSPVAQLYHSTNPGQGCFDDKEGDDSIEWVFYEDLYDQLASHLCFDKNRVFAAGNSSGAWVANELGCKYAGDAKRPIRGVMPNAGGLPTDPKYVPTCTNNPLAGIWVFSVDDTGNAINYSLPAINRALKVNGCTPTGVQFQSATFDNFPIGVGISDMTCRKVSGCPDRDPVVVCPLQTNAHSSDDLVVIPAFTAFVKFFSTAPLLTPSAAAPSGAP
jgi:hypothetical protein